MFGKKKKSQGPDSFVIQIPHHYTKAALFSGRKVEKIVAQWAKKGYRLHSMTPITSGNPFLGNRVTHYALNFHKVDAAP
jgi:hypothetical protein